VRSRADDGRSFYGTSADMGRSPPVVLRPDAPWEGGALSGPHVLRVGDELRLYYGAAGGIGLARSSDGMAFQKAPGPVLASDASVAWEAGPPRQPTVFVLPGGGFRMLYEAGAAIGEAESDDGVTWRRRDADPATPDMDPVLGAAPPAHDLRPNEKPPFDTAAVGDPVALLRTTAAGRLHLRVLYTGRDAAGQSAIGFAARYGVEGPLTRQVAPVYSAGQRERSPAFVETGGGSFLYVQQERRVDATTTYWAIAGAFAPANVHLGTPASFPDGP
jgi:hypothetical protein